MALETVTVGMRKALAVVSLIVGGTSIALPSPYDKVGIALATGMNAASLYLLKEEVHPSPTSPSEPLPK